MANFRAHLTAASLVSGTLATTSIYADLATINQAMLLWFIGTIGGLCPDLDSKNSISQRVGFLLFCGICGWIMGTILPERMPLPLALASIIATLCLLFYFILPKLCAIMNHRGNCHSLLTAVVISLALTNINAYLLGSSSADAFLVGLAFFCGFLSHLLLDEWCSIDFQGRRLKKSFGTAIKLFSLRTPASSLALIILCASQIWILPPHDVLRSVLTQVTMTLITLG